MTGASPERVQEIIDKGLQVMQDQADQVKAVMEEFNAQREAQQALLEPVVEWEDVPADVSDETLIAIMSQGKSFLFNYCKEGFGEKLQEFLQDLGHNNKERLIGIIQELRAAQMQEMMLGQIPLQPDSLTLQVYNDKSESGEWTFVAVPVMIDGNFKASVPEKLPVELQISLDVRPHAGQQGLTETFNLQAQVMPVGAEVKPTVLTYQSDNDDPKELHVNAYFRNDDEIQPIYQVMPFPNGDSEPKGDDDWRNLNIDLFGGDEPEDEQDGGPSFGGPKP